jgi:pimeloyl-ACP methyl ester carboxylesterase
LIFKREDIMKNTTASIKCTVIFAALILTSDLADSQIAWPSRLPSRLSSHGPATQRAQALNLQTTASPDILWIQCPAPAKALGATCGKLPVPLDRQKPDGAKINIYFEQYFHTNPGPPASAIMLDPGGPGTSITAFRTTVLAYFGTNLDAHDLLLIDDRGRGGSGVINCPELQYGTAPIPKAEADCAAQLGNRASLYGTGDVAMDDEAVRAALGYDKVDFWGGSYGGEDVTAYATRFGEHLRSIIMDAPMGSPALRPFALDGENARATVREVRLDCQRSPTCSADHSKPDSDIAQLIQSVRHKPVWGWANNASGRPVHVTLNEGALLYLASYPTGGFTFVSTGEILAAGSSLSQGDPAPLLRLGAEVTPLVSNLGDPTIGSQGDSVATTCADVREPWNWSDSIPERIEEFTEAVSELPSDFFAPFSHAAGTYLGVSLEKPCLWWQKPTPSSPVLPPYPSFPNVPTLVLSGDMDTLVATEEVRQVAAQFPGSTFVKVAEAGHLTIFWTQCSANLQTQFFETLQVGDTTCTQTPETVWPALGRFPIIAADARPAEIDPAGSNQIGEDERKVVTVAVATVTDALKRSSITLGNGGSGNGVGLRAGTFQTSFDANLIKLRLSPTVLLPPT